MQNPGAPHIARHCAMQAAPSHGGGWHWPPEQVSPWAQSAFVQHWLAHTQALPLLPYPPLQVKSQAPAAEQVETPFAGAAGQGEHETDWKQPVAGVFPAQTPPQRCCIGPHPPPVELDALTELVDVVDELVVELVELVAEYPLAVLLVPVAPLVGEPPVVLAALSPPSPPPPTPLPPTPPPPPPKTASLPVAHPTQIQAPMSTALAKPKRIPFTATSDVACIVAQARRGTRHPICLIRRELLLNSRNAQPSSRRSTWANVGYLRGDTAAPAC